MNTSPYAAHQSGFSGASYTVSSDERSRVRLVTRPVINKPVEWMDSGAAPSVLTRKVTEAETFGREVSQYGHTENAIRPQDNRAKLPPTLQQAKAESALPAPSASDTGHHEVAVLLQDTLQKDGVTPLHRAAKEGNFECLKRLLLSAPGTLCNEKNNDGWTPLCLAAYNGHTECVRALLSVPDILVNEKNNGGWTPLCLAASYGHVECVRALLTAPDIRVYGSNDPLTPLHCTAREGHVERVKTLFNTLGFRLNEKDHKGWTPLHCAARNGHAECMKLLIASKEMNTTLLNAAREGQTQVLAEILAPVNKLQETAKSEVIMGVLNAADPYGKTPLCRAAQFGHEKVVALFLSALRGLPEEDKPGATMAVLSAADGLGRTPLYMAAAFGHDKIVTQLLAALHRLAKTEGQGVMAALVNASDLFGNTPVSQARSRRYYQIERLLTRAFPNALDTEKETGDAHTVGVFFNNALGRLNTLPKAARLNVVMAVLHHAREDVLPELDVAVLESYDLLVAEILAVLKRLPEAPEDVSRNQAILKLVDCLREDGETGFSYTCVASAGQEQLAELLQAFPILSAVRNGQATIVARILKTLATWPESSRCKAVTTVMAISDKDGGTALHVAAQSDQRAVVAHLLDTLDSMSEPERTDAIPSVMLGVDENGATPLYWAAYKGHHEVVGQLLNAVARLPETQRLEAFTAVVNAAAPNGATALYWAAFQGHDKVVAQFLQTVNDFPEAEKMAVFEAMGGVLNTPKRSPLSAAIDNGHEKIVDQLFQAFPLLSAVLGRHNHSVEQFMQALEGLPWAARCSAIMATLKKARADGATPLYIAASQGNIEIIKLLLGAGSTLLADGKHKEIREMLYSTCKVAEEDEPMEITPLRIAARHQHVETVRLLLEAIRNLFSSCEYSRN